MKHGVHPWLETHIGPLQNDSFCRIKPVDEILISSYEQKHRLLLPSYFTEFLTNVGELSLFRVRNYYRFHVFCPSAPPKMSEGSFWIECGWKDDARMFFKKAISPIDSREEVHLVDDQRIATISNFHTWIDDSISEIRKTYSATQWKSVTGPIKEFDSREQSVVLARRQYQWKVLQVDDSNVVDFEIANLSSQRLPFLTIGVTGVSRSGSSFKGSLRVNVSQIEPGQTKLVKTQCYKGIAMPSSLEFLPLPDPEPFQRDTFWEFKVE